ncbi:MAG: hypothetical protein KAJ19_12125, partial [Gammaproteobacteria bacterium]|nr:hypothetical protein [Gammaproteobacteria bacterium]
QSVFVAGDERDPLNVTVISTVGRGTLTIEITGDASSYVTTSVTSLIVGVGYSHFGIDLKIPENLPLTAVGQYTGWLSLMDGSVEIAAVELNFSITSYRGSVLADSSHHSAEDPDDPSYYRYFSDYLREQGMTLDELGSPTYPQYVDTAGLSNCETFMIMDTETEYTSAEIEAIHQFVEEGGTLLIVSEYYNSQTQSASFGFDYYNEILQPYGIQCERFEIGGNPDTSAGEVYGIAHGGAVDADPLVDGVFNLFILAGSTLSVDPSVAGAKGLFWYDSTRTHAIVATVEHGDGRVIAVSDGSILYDSSVYDAFKADADNLQLLENIARALLPERPSVLDIELNREELGEPANVTAYIFDDDIESVVITITTPNGTVLTPTVQESLGYRFVAGFILETAGFYEVTVTAQDADGNTRVVLRTFLMEADLVDDVVVLTVVYSLLGVVALGLGYVVLKKLGIGRRREREWEPTWTEGESGTPPTGAPPSIE